MSVEISNEQNLNEDEDEAWLYGENNHKNQSNEGDLGEANGEANGQQEINENEVVEKPDAETVQQDQEEVGKISETESPNNDEDVADENKNEDMEEQDEDEDDDDDGVNIVISDIKNITTQPAAGLQGLNRSKSVTGSATIVPATAMQTAKATLPVQTKGIELEAPGLINGVPTDQYEIGDLKDEDKPWLQPGADITDYFNYGFTEETWIAYCLKQKRLRSENNMLKSGIQIMQNQTGVMANAVNGPNVNGSSLIAINTHSTLVTGQPPGNQPNFNPNMMPPPQSINFPKPPQFHPRFPPPVGQAGPQPFQQRMGDQFNMPPPHIPDFSAPPPNWNPSGGPGGQQGLMPRMSQMPPQRMPNMPMSGQQQPFNAPFQYGPQHGMHDRPPPGMPSHFYPQFNRGSGQMMSQGPQWEKGGDPQHRPSRSPTPGRKSPLKSPNQQTSGDRFSKDSEKYKSRDYANRDYDKDHRRSPSPSRRHRRDHDRRDYDRRERDRDRDRDGGRSREKSRERSRERSRSRDRDDKYKRSRHRSDEDDYRSSSKSHKRSKKSSRKDRDSNDREFSSNPSQNQENTEIKQD